MLHTNVSLRTNRYKITTERLSPEAFDFESGVPMVFPFSIKTLCPLAILFDLPFFYPALAPFRSTNSFICVPLLGNCNTIVAPFGERKNPPGSIVTSFFLSVAIFAAAPNVLPYIWYFLQRNTPLLQRYFPFNYWFCVCSVRFSFVSAPTQSNETSSGLCVCVCLCRRRLAIGFA